jgi:hypothetical protein
MYRPDPGRIGVFQRRGSDEPDEVVLCDPNAEVIHVLNPTANLIWDLCDGQHSLAEIEQAVRKAFAVPPERDVLADIREALASFGEKALLIEG